ncbi:MAG: ParB/RepB/Spo0J family partition protein [Legionellales bacterium]|nr:ParB/RepB/Spo0J family partition protein [Legionellales bacterium]
MDNSKRNIHSSGPLGMLMKSGQVKKIENTSEQAVMEKEVSAPHKTGASYFKTQSGIEFSEQELVYVDPKECEPWQYANRQDEELGDIAELIESIKANKQLQPALIRNHPTPHDGIKYEVIFGRRRHLACLKLGIPFLAIRKAIPNVQDAIASQDAENKLRNDVSNYSNAILYKRLLSDGVFKTEKELAEKLRLSASTLNDLMAYAKIPADIVKKIPNIHTLSKQIVVKIVQLLNKSKDNHQKIMAIADQLGTTITSHAKLEQIFNKKSTKAKKHTKTMMSAKTYSTATGKKLFTFKSDNRGLPSIVINKEVIEWINLDEICDHLSNYLEKTMTESGYPD